MDRKEFIMRTAPLFLQEALRADKFHFGLKGDSSSIYEKWAIESYILADSLFEVILQNEGENNE